jgi:3-methylfumaryl-CoA hydratase
MTSVEGLGRFVQNWAPEPVETPDTISLERVRELIATLDLDIAVAAGDSLPVVWHWIFFHDWPRSSDLGVDGHPANGPFLPTIPNRRRMFAGATINNLAPLPIGGRVVRRSAVESVTPKVGSSGEMLFVRIRNEFLVDGAVARIETQDIVYRSGDPDAAPSPLVDRGSEPTAGAPWSDVRTHTPTTLFRYSALTANAHRIHYDQPYARSVEKYPGLVVHGPLLATLMAHLVEAARGVDAVESFSFRLRRPVFAGTAVLTEGWPDDDSSKVRLSVSTGTDVVHATAEVALR